VRGKCPCTSSLSGMVFNPVTGAHVGCAGVSCYNKAPSTWPPKSILLGFSISDSILVPATFTSLFCSYSHTFDMTKKYNSSQSQGSVFHVLLITSFFSSHFGVCDSNSPATSHYLTQPQSFPSYTPDFLPTRLLHTTAWQTPKLIKSSSLPEPM
jgi:hypothetical protein